MGHISFLKFSHLFKQLSITDPDRIDTQGREIHWAQLNPRGVTLSLGLWGDVWFSEFRQDSSCNGSSFVVLHEDNALRHSISSLASLQLI